MYTVINLKVLQRMLARIGVKTKAVNSASRALDYLKSVEDTSELPNLILTDFNMPGKLSL